MFILEAKEEMRKEEKDRDLTTFLFAGLSLLKENSKSFLKKSRQPLIVTRAVIDYLLLLSGEEKKSKSVKKIKIK